MGQLITNTSKEIAERSEGFGALIQADSNGYLYAAHINESDELEVYRSINSGFNWTLDETFSEASAIDMPFLCRDFNSTNNDIYLSYSYGAASPYGAKVKRRNEDTGTWTEVYATTSQKSENGKLQIFLCFNQVVTNRLHMIWLYEGSPDRQLRSYYSDDNGASWSNLSAQNLPSFIVDILVSIDRYQDKIYVTGMDISSNDLITFEYNSDGEYNSNEFTTGNNDGTAYGGAMVITRSGIMYHAIFLYESGITTYKLRVLYYDLSLPSDSWHLQISESDPFVMRKGTLNLSADGNNNVYLFYVKDSDNSFYRKFTSSAGSWGSEQALVSNFRTYVEKHNKYSADKLNYVYFDTVA